MLKLNENYYDIEEDKKKKIEKIINKYIELIYHANKDELILEDSIYFTMLIGEALPLCEDKHKAEDVIYDMMNRIRKGIYNGEIRSMSLFGGLTEVGLSIYLVHKSTGHYTKFLNSINDIICTFIEKNIDTYKKNINDLKMQHFECIQGLAGIATYLLWFKDEDRINSTLKLILEYFVSLTNNKIVYEYEVPGWYVSSKNQFREDTKLQYEKGNFNFGLSHGIAGPLVVLSKAYTSGIRVEGQFNAIRTIVDNYMEFKEIDENGNVYWPTLLGLEDYLNKSKLARENKKASWCYGTIGIARSLYFAAAALKSNSLNNMVIDIYEKISLTEREEYYLISPTLCHGYSGIISILNVMYKDCKNQVIKVRVRELVDILLEYYNKDAKYGFENINPIFDSNKEGVTREDRADFLEGTTGVILTLLSLFKGDSLFERHLLIN